MIKFTVTTTHSCADLIADIVMNFSAAGVSVEDKEDVAELWNSTLVWDYIEDSVLNRPEEVRVSGFYDGEFAAIEAKLNEMLAAVKANVQDCGSLAVSVEPIAETDWAEDWKKFYEIIEVGSISVVPVWKSEQYHGIGVPVIINPGAAFGTGEHESTKLCLELLNKVDVSGKTVIDTGCGSGILGIAALKLGAKSCLFRDIDEAALNNLRENMALNGVQGRVQCASLLESVTEKPDIVLANITADILSRMTNCGEVLGSGGVLIMSGIVNKYADALIKQYQAMGFTLKTRLDDDMWVGLMMVKD